MSSVGEDVAELSGDVVALADGHRRRGPSIGNLLRRRELGLVLALVLLAVIVGSQAPRFLGFDNVRNILQSVSILAILAVGQTLVVLTRNIDLSVASSVGLVAYIAADTLKAHPGVGVVLVVLLGIAIGAGLGAFNGVLVTVGEVPSIVATLGTLYVYRGIDFLIAGGKDIDASDMPQSFLNLTATHSVGVPPPVLIALAVTAIAGYLLRGSVSGRQLYAIGSNPDAARIAGIRSGRLVFGTFVACGALCGLAGVLWASFYGTVTANAATGQELQVVAAVVVGGVNIFGGSGSVAGVLLAAVLFGGIDNGLSVLKISEFWLQAITGAAIIAAVAVDAVVAGRIRRALTRRAVR